MEGIKFVGVLLRGGGWTGTRAGGGVGGEGGGGGGLGCCKGPGNAGQPS